MIELGVGKMGREGACTVKNDLLIAQQIDQREKELLILGRLRIVGLQRHHHVRTGLARMGTVALVRRHLVDGAAPLAADARVLAIGRPILALGRLVVVDRFVRELLRAVLAFGRQLRHRFLDRQVARRVVLANLGATVRAGRVLVAQPGE